MSSIETYPNYSEQRPERAEVAQNPVSQTTDSILRRPPSSAAVSGSLLQSDFAVGNTLYGNVVVNFQHQAQTQAARSATIEELYSQLEGTSRLKQALALLDEAIKQLEAALSLDADPVACDDNVQVMYSLLPELFCCRSLGDGFASVINALQQAASNQHGIPINASQIETILVILRKLRQSPFLAYSDALDLVMKLEDSGLVVDPPALSHLVDSPSDEENSVR